MNTNIPDNLMTNVEKALRKHIKDKQRKRHIYKATVTAAIIFLVILPGSVFAYAQYNNSIVYEKEIDLARENKNITEVNQIFEYKDVNFTIKEIVADDTGIEVIYDVSDPKYSIRNVSFGDKDNKGFETWGYTTPDLNSTNNEKAFNISIDNTTANYMHNNPITITINSLKINDEQSDSPFNKLSALFNQDNEPKVDWTLKMQVPMQQVKVIPVNKEYSLDIGTLKVNSFKASVLKSVLDYTFVPNDKSITMINPIFSVRLDNDYIISKGGKNHGTNSGSVTGLQTTLPIIDSDAGISGAQEFNCIYYNNNIKDIGVQLIGVEVTYDFNDPKTFKVDKNKLPQEFDLNGEKVKITSIEQKGDSTECTVDFDKTNRIYSSLLIMPLDIGVSSFKNTNGTIEYKDQPSRNAIYNSLSSKIPNLKDMEKKFLLSMNSQEGVISANITITPQIAQSDIVEFIVYSATKNLIYDKEEVIVHKK